MSSKTQLKISVMTGKLTGISAINSDTTANKFCNSEWEKGKQTDNRICGFCYSQSMLRGSRKNCVDSWRRNLNLLKSGEFDMPYLNYHTMRLHGHGELEDYNMMVSFHKIITNNPLVTFTLWTKRVDIIRKYLNEYDKPDNLILIYSNPIIDMVMTKAPRGFDKVFNTVREPSELENCTGQKCIDCMKCYDKSNVEACITERVKIRS